ncbi:RagB/SusD family nutrient uptake outer membrane protein [Sphingobacterium gobiense]|uniref:RagB/SusD family nutrient uptake outer membrane protein n=1 Tax=Sphingobacterium gobiense TaxID=1382456 RepID=A0A2S9JTS8_9SPHI|nr:RagB/SusD family nutrient uptake outer membrane protein [Sphingobacterium gobiense]PRD56695.1 RagB/SusD family nutrient uptake outer membrane protein [Sphingobacterium gobiense]
MNKILKYTAKFRLLSVLTAVILASSCNDFLDEKPSKSSDLVVTTTEDLDALLNNFSAFYSEGNRTAIYSTDDYGLTTAIYNGRPATFGMAAIEFSLWDIDYLPDDTREGFWRNEYTKIFNANMVLENLGRVSGSEADKSRLKADAHFIRAYSYFALANVYCLPYNESTADELGLTLKTGTSFDDPTERSSLAEVYTQIEADLAEALSTPVPLVQQGRARHWRTNTAAVNGFAARYYLIRNNYEKALQYANEALSEYSELVDYNTDMRYGRSSTVTINAGTPNAESVTIQFPYTHDNQQDFIDMIQWKEFLYFRMLNHESWWYLPSQALIDLYDRQHDLRYAYHMIDHYSYDRGMINPSFDWPGYVFFYKDRIPSGPTTAEMYLIKAECLARLNRVPEALTAVNTLRAKRMKPGAWVNISATDNNNALQKILEERRRELPFTQRWNDIRRFNNNNYAADDVELEKTFYPYTASNVTADQAPKVYKLPKDSRRFAAPIPRTEIISSRGAIVQNTY